MDLLNQMQEQQQPGKPKKKEDFNKLQNISNLKEIAKQVNDGPPGDSQYSEDDF